MRQYREVTLDNEVKLILAGCDCDGYDIVTHLQKSTKVSTESCACFCGLRRGRRKPSGGWSMVIDESAHAPISVTAQPVPM